MDINQILNDIINYNKEQQILTYIKVCNDQPRNSICRNVDKNNYEKWHYYFSQNNNQNLFSKGTNRFETFINLLKEDPRLYFSKEIIAPDNEQKAILINMLNNLKTIKRQYYFFILAGLIIIFQVFGDANHRTAKFFYKKATGKDISLQQEIKINDLLRNNDYYTISNNPIIKMNDIINELIEIITTVNGGKKFKRRSILIQIKPKLTRKNKNKNKNKNKKLNLRKSKKRN